MREVVIKMSDEMYDWFLTGFPDKVDINELQRLVIEGTILPKGRGKLLVISDKYVKDNMIEIFGFCQKFLGEVDLSLATVAVIEEDGGNIK